MVNQSIDELERIANHTIDPNEDVTEQDMVIVCGDLLALIRIARAAKAYHKIIQARHYGRMPDEVSKSHAALCEALKEAFD